MYDEIARFKASSLLDAFAGGRADYVMVDVEGFDDSVVYNGPGAPSAGTGASEARSCSVRPGGLMWWSSVR